jgi:hypothetical protein
VAVAAKASQPDPKASPPEKVRASRAKGRAGTIAAVQIVVQTGVQTEVQTGGTTAGHARIEADARISTPR